MGLDSPSWTRTKGLVVCVSCLSPPGGCATVRIRNASHIRHLRAVGDRLLFDRPVGLCGHLCRYACLLPTGWETPLPVRNDRYGRDASGRSIWASPFRARLPASLAERYDRAAGKRRDPRTLSAADFHDLRFASQPLRLRHAAGSAQFRARPSRLQLTPQRKIDIQRSRLVRVCPSACIRSFRQRRRL